MQAKHKILIALGVAVMVLVFTAFLAGYTNFVYHKGFVNGYGEALNDTGFSKYIPNSK